MTTKSPAAKHLNHLIKYTITIVLVAWTKTTTNGDEQKKKKKSITTKCCVRICGLAWDGDISNEEKEREESLNVKAFRTHLVSSNLYLLSKCFVFCIKNKHKWLNVLWWNCVCQLIAPFNSIQYHYTYQFIYETNIQR